MGIMDFIGQATSTGDPMMGETVDTGPLDEDVISEIDAAFDKYKHGRQNFERNWYRNILFRHGIQWIVFDETTNTVRKRRLPSYVPTPVTNKFMETGERISSIISRVEPNWNFIPASDNETDINTAKTCDKLEPVICEENNTEKLREKVSKWLTYTGNGFILSGVQADSLEKEKLYTDVYSPFEVFGNMMIEEIDAQESLIIVCRKDKDYIKRTYGVEVSNTDTNELGLTFLESLAFATQSSGTTYRTDNKTRGVIIKIGIFRPCEKFPEGLFAVVGDGKVLDKQTLFKTPDGDFIFPMEHFKFDTVPGSFMGSTPMHDIVPKQEQLNRLDSMMELIGIRMASPVWVIPEGTVVKNFSGEPGAQLRFQSMGDNKNAPNRLAGENMPSSLFLWREKLGEDIEGLANTFEALKGNTPYSGAPNSAIETLVEQGLTRFGPCLRGIAENWRRWMKTQLELFRLFQMQRKHVEKGESSEWEMKSFSSADMQGAINVRIESDSTVPRSQHIYQTKIASAIQGGLIDMKDPMIRMKALQELKLEDFAGDLTADVLDAVRENELLAKMDPQQVILMDMAGQPPIQVMPFIQNDAVHIAKHRIFALSPEGRPYLPFLLKHVTQHDMNMNAMMNPGLPPPPQPTDRTLNKGEKAGIAPQDKTMSSAMSPASNRPVQ